MTGAAFTIIDRNNNIFFDPTIATNGLDINGNKCSTFHENPTGICRFRIDFTFKVLCNASIGCDLPTQIQIDAKIKYVSSSTENSKNQSLYDVKIFVNLISEIRALDISAGSRSASVLTDDGRLLSWGDNSFSYAGAGHNNSPLVLAEFAKFNSTSFVENAVRIGKNYSSHNCVILEDTSVYCAGKNEDGDAGVGNTSPYEVYYKNTLGIDGGSELTNIEYIGGSEGGLSFAISNTKKIFTWGGNGEDVSGAPVNRMGASQTQWDAMLNGGMNPVPIAPEAITAALDFWKMTSGTELVTFNSGAAHSCVLLDNGKISCWGAGTKGQLGDGNINMRDFPDSTSFVIYESNDSEISSATAIEAKGEVTCAIVDPNGNVFCWGDNSRGALGANIDPAQIRAKAVQVVFTDGTPLADAKILFSATKSFCAILTNGRIACWGNNTHGQLGRGTTSQNERTAEYVLNIDGINIKAKLGAGGHNHFCIVTESHKVYCWGRNGSGALGANIPIGSDEFSAIPVLVEAFNQN